MDVLYVCSSQPSAAQSSMVIWPNRTIFPSSFIYPFVRPLVCLSQIGDIFLLQISSSTKSCNFLPFPSPQKSYFPFFTSCIFRLLHKNKFYFAKYLPSFSCVPIMRLFLLLFSFISSSVLLFHLKSSVIITFYQISQRNHGCGRFY